MRYLFRMSTRKVIRAKKKFIVVAYDVTDNKRRRKVVKILEKAGNRINFSVFECMVTDLQFARLQKELLDVIDSKEDRIVYYPICMKCYTKTVYQFPKLPSFDMVKVV